MCIGTKIPDPTPPAPPPKEPPRRVDEDVQRARAGAKTAARKRLGLRGTFKDSTFGTAKLATSKLGSTTIATNFGKEV